MVSIKFFRNETQLPPITAEPVVYLTREELQRRRRELAAELRFLPCDGPPHGSEPIAEPVGKCNDWQELDAVHDQAAAQHDATVETRRKWRAKQADQELVQDEDLRADAEKKVQRLGVREHLEPSLNVVNVVVTAQSVQESRTRITAKTGTTGTRQRRLPESLMPQIVGPTGGLGESKVVLHRGSAQTGARVIA